MEKAGGEPGVFGGDKICRSKSVFELVKGSHQFIIKGLSLAMGMGPGKFLSSDKFTAGDYQWAVYFYPDGTTLEDNALYASAFIALASEGTDVRALFELTLLDQSGKGKHKVHTHLERALENGPYTLKYQGSMWGYKRFYRKTLLETSNYVKDDCLIMNCTVGVVQNHLETVQHLLIPVPPPDMRRSLKELLKSGIGSDVIFEVGDVTFNAHKLILAARSPVFKAQFFGLFGNGNIDKVVVEDVEPPVFKAMLMYMYSDELPNVVELSGPVLMCTSTNMVQHLLVAADRYGLDRLKLLCESKLSEEINADIVASTMLLAEQHNCAYLKYVCLKFISAKENLGGRFPSSLISRAMHHRFLNARHLPSTYVGIFMLLLYPVTLLWLDEVLG
ncbi:BTB/POZ and MATH domain-containing protein 3 [Apostasia shenzhenica]|uniref:BTB/POZ and MATH domain-containing protein 3 n=1 Tax=Apostasia shenzhenica TaxID=1088818 RepID=A0A2H9ZS40_9ASPA|nr:BTB/POZ and MATH domain-containing protein 3 [Apostasia shenzhenica]